MRILFTSIRNTGHYLPLVPFIEACARAGHEVAVAAPPDLAERVAKTPARFLPFGHPGDEGLRPLWQRMREVPENERGSFTIREIFAGACAQAALPALLETLSSFRPAIVVRESQEYAALIAAEKLGVPHAHVAITLPSAEHQYFEMAAPSLERLAREHALAPERMSDVLAVEPVLTSFPKSLDEASFHNPRLFRYATRLSQQPALPDYWTNRPAGPIVYLTLGTVAGGLQEAHDAYRVALDAVAPLSIRVLLTIGNELPLETLGAVPENVHVERFVPQDQVLPAVAAVIGHGGSGTTLGTLAAGVPTVIMPLFADQPVNAQRVHASGAGIGLPPTGVTPEALRAALLQVLEAPAFRAAAQRMAGEIAQLPDLAQAPADLERLAGAP